jgi:deoxyadenosine/deoxycytidine kinase
MTVGLRNTKKTMVWIKSEPSYDQIVEKIEFVKNHINKCGEFHPSISALFLLKQEALRLSAMKDHMQRDLFDDLGSAEKANAKSNNLPSKKADVYASSVARDNVFKGFKEELKKLSLSHLD